MTLIIWRLRHGSFFGAVRPVDTSLRWAYDRQMKWEAHCPEDGTAHGKRVPVPFLYFFLFRPLNPIPLFGSDTSSSQKFTASLSNLSPEPALLTFEAWIFIRARLLAAQGIEDCRTPLWIDTTFGCGLSSLRRALSYRSQGQISLWETGAWIFLF